MTNVPGPVATWWLGSRFVAGPLPELEIHCDDEMFEFARGLHFASHDLATAHYFWQGQRIAQLLEDLLARLEGRGRILDFASGFGRVTRWLAARLGCERVVAAEIQPDAVRFLTDRLGVSALQSSFDPQEFCTAETFELVWAGSLFTHLPVGRFEGWLATLGSRVNPNGGMLAFSVFPQSLAPAAARERANGHWYLPSSESDRLSPEEYGTAWVSDGFLAAALDGLPGRWSWVRIPGGVVDFQDLVLAVPEGGERLLQPGLDPGPQAVVERAELRPGTRLELAGWAYHLARRESVGAVRAGVPGSIEREARDLGPRGRRDLEPQIAPAEPVEFELELELSGLLEPLNSPFFLSVLDRQGREKLLRIETVGTLLLCQARFERDLWQRRAGLLSASRFGALQRLWLRFKDRTGLLPASFPRELLEPPPGDQKSSSS